MSVISPSTFSLQNRELDNEYKQLLIRYDFEFTYTQVLNATWSGINLIPIGQFTRCLLPIANTPEHPIKGPEQVVDITTTIQTSVRLPGRSDPITRFINLNRPAKASEFLDVAGYANGGVLLDTVITSETPGCGIYLMEFNMGPSYGVILRQHVLSDPFSNNWTGTPVVLDENEPIKLSLMTQVIYRDDVEIKEPEDTVTLVFSPQCFWSVTNTVATNFTIDEIVMIVPRGSTVTLPFPDRLLNLNHDVSFYTTTPNTLERSRFAFVNWRTLSGFNFNAGATFVADFNTTFRPFIGLGLSVHVTSSIVENWLFPRNTNSIPPGIVPVCPFPDMGVPATFPHSSSFDWMFFCLNGEANGFQGPVVGGVQYIWDVFVDSWVTPP